MGFFGDLWNGITHTVGGVVGGIPGVGSVVGGVAGGLGGIFGGSGSAVNNTPYINQPYTPAPVVISAPAPVIIPTKTGVDNTMLYIGLGIVAVIIVLVLTGVVK